MRASGARPDLESTRLVPCRRDRWRQYTRDQKAWDQAATGSPTVSFAGWVIAVSKRRFPVHQYNSPRLMLGKTEPKHNIK